jgi:hypothetical protein
VKVTGDGMLLGAVVTKGMERLSGSEWIDDTSRTREARSQEAELGRNYGDREARKAAAHTRKNLEKSPKTDVAVAFRQKGDSVSVEIKGRMCGGSFTWPLSEVLNSWEAKVEKIVGILTSCAK